MASQTIPQHMKAQVLEDYNTPYVFTTLPVPELANEHDLLIKVGAAGYCHTDSLIAEGLLRPAPRNFPHVGSHEFAGAVVAQAISPSSAAEAYPIGTRVGVPGRGFYPCGSCFECRDEKNDRAGYSYYCPNVRSNGINKHGGFAEYALVDARQVVPLPDGLEMADAAPLMCAGITIYNALKRCTQSAGQRVGIMGCGGGLGHLGLQFAEAMGLRVTGVEAADGPLKLAKSLNTNAEIVDARVTNADDLVQQIGKEDNKSERANMGLDAVIILPESQASFNYGVKLLRNHGVCIVVSIAEKGFQVSSWDLVYRDITVRGTMLGTNSVLRETVEFAAKHNISAVKKAFGLAALNDLVKEYGKGEGGRMVVDMSL